MNYYNNKNQVVTTSANGRVVTVQNVNSDNTNGNLTTYTYDEFDRQIGAAETNGNATVNTTSATYDNAGNILTQTVNGQTTSFEYDVMGRQIKVTAPGGVVTDTSYYPTGEVQRIDGATYPVEYTYNNLGKQATMTTYKDANTPQVTTWTYDNRGNLASKKYPYMNQMISLHRNNYNEKVDQAWSRQMMIQFSGVSNYIEFPQAMSLDKWLLQFQNYSTRPPDIDPTGNGQFDLSAWNFRF